MEKKISRLACRDFSQHKLFEPKASVQQLTQMMSELEIYRIKSFVSVPNKAMRLVLNGVGNRFYYFYDRP